MDPLQPQDAPRREVEARIRRVEGALGHAFVQPELLDSALRMTEPGSDKLVAIHPLEVAGYALIEVSIGRRVYQQFARDGEADLRRVFEGLVNKHTLKRIGDGLHLHQFIHPLPSPLPGSDWGSTRNGQMVCAIVEAARRDRGLARAEALVIKLFASLDPHSVSAKFSGAAEPSFERAARSRGVLSVRERFQRFLNTPRCLSRGIAGGEQDISSGDRAFLRMLGEEVFRLAYAIRTPPSPSETSRISELGQAVRNLAPANLLKREIVGAWLGNAPNESAESQHIASLFLGLGTLLVVDGIDTSLSAADTLWSKPAPSPQASPEQRRGVLQSASLSLDPCIALDARLEGHVVGRITYSVTQLSAEAAAKRGASHLCEIWISSKKCGFGQGASETAARQGAARDVICKLDNHTLRFKLRS